MQYRGQNKVSKRIHFVLSTYCPATPRDEKLSVGSIPYLKHVPLPLHSLRLCLDKGEALLTVTSSRSEPGEMECTEPVELDQSDSLLLFKEPFKGTWDLQLWVKPQCKHLEKLFRFGKEHPGTAKHLSDFLLPSKINAGDCRLYMEAHVILKRCDTTTVG